MIKSRIAAILNSVLSVSLSKNISVIALSALKTVIAFSIDYGVIAVVELEAYGRVGVVFFCEHNFAIICAFCGNKCICSFFAEECKIRAKLARSLQIREHIYQQTHQTISIVFVCEFAIDNELSQINKGFLRINYSDFLKFSFHLRVIESEGIISKY